MLERVREFLSSYVFLNNDLWQWTLSLLIIVGGYLTVKILYFLFSKILKPLVLKTETKTDDIVVETTEKPVMLAVMLASVWWAIHRLSVSPMMLTIVDYAYQFLIIVNVCWVITRISEGLINEYARRKEKEADYRIRVIVRIIKWVVWILGILTALNNMGVNVGAVIAGLGIGGVAVAFAAQDTIKNLFAGFVIFFDKPFKIGDRIVVGVHDGYVEDIGLRSVRVRLLSRQLVTLPTALVVDAAVVNVTAEPARRITVELGLTYGTTPEKMQQALQILKDAPKNISQIEEVSYAYFVGYGDSSLNLKYLYDIKAGEDFFETQSVVNLHILKEFNKNGLDFAFPTRTVYVKN